MKTTYVISIDDGETHVFPLDGLETIEVDDDDIDELHEMADNGASLAQIRERFVFGDAPNPGPDDVIACTLAGDDEVTDEIVETADRILADLKATGFIVR